MNARASNADRRETWVMALVFAGLLVLPLIGWGLVKAVSRPRRIPCYGGNAISSCRAYAEAQFMYKKNDWDQDGKLTYAPTFPLLHTTPDENGVPIQFIDAAFAGAGPGGAPKHGYLFRDMVSIAGQPIDWEKDCALCATPAVHGRTGYRTFIVKADGTVFGKDFGGSRFVDDFPADPTAEGWIIAE